MTNAFAPPRKILAVIDESAAQQALLIAACKAADTGYT